MIWTEQEKAFADWRAYDESFLPYKIPRPNTLRIWCGMCHCYWYEDIGCNPSGQCPECGECFPKYYEEDQKC